jgi:hypothetical protein
MGEREREREREINRKDIRVHDLRSSPSFITPFMMNLYNKENEKKIFRFSRPISMCPMLRKDRKESYIYEKATSHLIFSHPSIPTPPEPQSSPPKPALDILPPEINLHILLALGIRIDSSHQPLRPLQRALVTLLRLSAHEADQVARDVGALALDVTEMLLDSAA